MNYSGNSRVIPVSMILPVDDTIGHLNRWSTIADTVKRRTMTEKHISIPSPVHGRFRSSLNLAPMIALCLAAVISCDPKGEGKDVLCMQEVEMVKVNHYSLSNTVEIILEETLGVGKEKSTGNAGSFDVTLSEKFPASWTHLAPPDSLLEVASMVEGETRGRWHSERVGEGSELTFRLENIPLLASLVPGNCCGAVGCDTTCGQGCAAIFSFQMKIPKEEFDLSRFADISYSTDTKFDENGERVVRVICNGENRALKNAYYAFLVPTLVAGYEIRVLSHAEGLTKQGSRAYNHFFMQSDSTREEVWIEIGLKEIRAQAVGQLYFDNFVRVSGKIKDDLLFQSCDIDFNGTVNRSEKSELVYSGDLIIDIS